MNVGFRRLHPPNPMPALVLCRHSRNSARKPEHGSPAALSSETTMPDKTHRAPTLKDTVRLTGNSSFSVQVLDRGGPLSVDSYMRLPIEQYSHLDSSMIEPLGGNTFRLIVPRISMFNLWVQPSVDILVTLLVTHGTQPRVILTGTKCHLTGSELVQRMHLEERFALHFVTQLVWSPSPLAAGGLGSITGHLETNVLTEIIPPFHVLPRSVMQGTCNGVLRGLIRSLLPLFMRKLGQDYDRWATDASYRRARGRELTENSEY